VLWPVLHRVHDDAHHVLVVAVLVHWQIPCHITKPNTPMSTSDSDIDTTDDDVDPVDAVFGPEPPTLGTLRALQRMPVSYDADVSSVDLALPGHVPTVRCTALLQHVYRVRHRDFVPRPTDDWLTAVTYEHLGTRDTAPTWRDVLVLVTKLRFFAARVALLYAVASGDVAATRSTLADMHAMFPNKGLMLPALMTAPLPVQGYYDWLPTPAPTTPVHVLATFLVQCFGNKVQWRRAAAAIVWRPEHLDAVFGNRLVADDDDDTAAAPPAAAAIIKHSVDVVTCLAYVRAELPPEVDAAFVAECQHHAVTHVLVGAANQAWLAVHGL
jgi:hypothetical protein